MQYCILGLGSRYAILHNISMIMKGNGQRTAHWKVSSLAVHSGTVPQRIAEPTTNRLVVGWTPTGPITSIHPTSSVNCLRVPSGLRQRQGCDTAVILALALKKVKV